MTRSVGRRLAVLAALGLAWIVAPSSASACSCAGDDRPYLFLGAGNTIPAGEVGIAWYDGSGADLDPRRFRIEHLDDQGRWAEGTFTIRELGPGIRELIPADLSWGRLRISLRPFIFYRRTSGQRPEDRPLEPFSVIEEVSRSDRALDGSAPISIRVGAPQITAVAAYESGRCSRELRASAVRIEPTIPPGIEPFVGYLLFETLVDGAPWTPRAHVCDGFPRGRNRLSRVEAPGVDVVYSECPEGMGVPHGYVPSYRTADGSRFHGIAPGDHLVQVIASSPDGRFRLASQSVKITLPEVKVEPEVEPEVEPAPPPVTPRRCTVVDPRSPAGFEGLGILALLSLRRRSRRRG